jgi:hypothetical protein
MVDCDKWPCPSLMDRSHMADCGDKWWYLGLEGVGASRACVGGQQRTHHHQGLREHQQVTEHQVTANDVTDKQVNRSHQNRVTSQEIRWGHKGVTERGHKKSGRTLRSPPSCRSRRCGSLSPLPSSPSANPDTHTPFFFRIRIRIADVSKDNRLVTQSR